MKRKTSIAKTRSTRGRVIVELRNDRGQMIDVFMVTIEGTTDNDLAMEIRKTITNKYFEWAKEK